jgi:hypothetical protein
MSRRRDITRRRYTGNSVGQVQEAAEPTEIEEEEGGAGERGEADQQVRCTTGAHEAGDLPHAVTGEEQNCRANQHAMERDEIHRP